MAVRQIDEKMGVLYHTEKSGAFTSISEPRPLLRKVNDQFVEYLEKSPAVVEVISPEDRMTEDYMVNFREIADFMTKGMMAQAANVQMNVLGVINKGLDITEAQENTKMMLELNKSIMSEVQDKDLIEKGFAEVESKLRESFKRMGEK